MGRQGGSLDSLGIYCHQKGKSKKKKAEKKPKPATYTPPEVDSSKNYRLDELASQLKGFNSEPEIQEFLSEDTRTGAKKMADLRIKELNQ